MPRRRPSSSPLLEPPVLIILLPIITLIFLFFIIPPFLSLTSQILRPTISVKKSWDSFNVFLVIFAILCGIFAKKNEDGSPADEDHIQDPVNVAGNSTNIPESESLLPQQWFGYSERNKIYDPPSIRIPDQSNGGGRLRRSSSSYPDLRQQPLWEDEQSRDDKSRFRFFDDFEINNYRSSSSTIDPNHHMRHRHLTKQTGYSKDCDDVKEIPVDTFQVLHSSPPPPKSPAPPPPPPPPPTATRHHQTTRRTYQTVGRKEKPVEEVNYEKGAEFAPKVRSPPPTPPPPPPPRPAPPSSPIRTGSEHKRRKSNVKREIAMVWASVLNNQRKRKKKQKVTTRDIYDSAASAPHDHSPLEQQEHHYYTRPPPSPPPPPPPPPPSSVFHSLFKKGGKTKKIHSVSPPPPPPQPPMQKHKSRSTRTTMPPTGPPTPPPHPPPTASRRRVSATSGRPPLPNKGNNFYDENVNSGFQTPQIPPPPPPPPFKMPELRFSVRGDFVKIRSAQSSRCGSPELDDVDSLAGEEDASLSSQSKRVNVMDGDDGGDGAGSVICPSPDVNTKADSFIARLRDEWRLEKMNSMREKNKMGHGPAQTQ